MADFIDLVKRRRSIRNFMEMQITDNELHTILRAGLMSPTGKSVRGWHFIVVKDKDKLLKASKCKNAGAAFISEAPVAIVVLYDKSLSDVWIEDASIAAVSMQYQAADLGIGSCWVQVRLRSQEDGTSADEALRSIFNYPQNLSALAVVAFGYPSIERKLQDEDKLKWTNVYIDGYNIDKH